MILYLIFNLFWVFIVWRFHTFFFENNYRKKELLLLSCAVFYIVNSSLHLAFHQPFINLFTSIGGIFLISLNYTAGFRKKLLSTALIYMLSLLCDFVTATSIQTYRSGMLLPPEATAIAYLLLFITELILERFFNVKKVQNLKHTHWFALITVPIGSMFIVCALVLFNARQRSLNLFILLTLLLINIMIFYLYDSIQNVYLKDLRQSYMEKQMEIYVMQMERMLLSQEKLYAFQHDMKHHITALSALAEGNHHESIQNYIAGLKNHMAQCSRQHFSCHPVTDGILNCMLNEHISEFTKLDVKIQIPEKIGLSDFDMSILLGNLLDNAVHAALNSEKKYLKIYMKTDRGVLYLIVENSYSGSLIIKNNKLQSSKKFSGDEKHGLGLENVRNIAEQHNGRADVSYDNQLFTVRIFLYLDSGTD